MIDLVLDAGHGGKDPGAIGPTGLQEKECTIYITKKCEELLKQQGITVKQTRSDDSYMGLSERAQIANKEGAKYFISIHINSADISSANGTEIYALAPGGEGEKISKVILNYLIDEIKLTNRGIKFANFAVLRETDMPATLVEVSFISNSKEENLLRNDNFKDKVALAIVKGYLSYVGKPYNTSQKNNIQLQTLTSIIEEPIDLKNQAKQWAKNKGATETFIGLADLYWELYESRGKVNPIVAYAQAALETGYGKFGGVVDESYKNPCGMKKSKGGDDSSVAAHTKFNTWADGVSAHLDHLALYADANGYPRSDTKDTRHFPYLLGTVKYVEELSGKWATTQDYGLKIIELMFEISNTIVVDNFQSCKLDDVKAEKPNLDDTNVNTTKNDQLNSIKDKLNNKKSELDKIKQEYDEMQEAILIVEGHISDVERENRNIKQENITLKEQVKKYQEIIEEILNIVNKINQ